jgi:hypothetical protein
MAAMLLSIASPASAAPAARSASSGAAPSTYTISVPLTTAPMAAPHTLTPNGVGPQYNLSCGSAQLTVVASTHRYRILLNSIKGTITYGVYIMSTDGVGQVNWPGVLNTGSTSSNNLGQIPVPGLWISTAYASGSIYTSQGSVCFFNIDAPWT